MSGRRSTIWPIGAEAFGRQHPRPLWLLPVRSPRDRTGRLPGGGVHRARCERRTDRCSSRRVADARPDVQGISEGFRAAGQMGGLAEKIRRADAFVFVAGEYNWGPQPGLKNLTDHFLEEWAWRPAAIASYSRGRLSGARANSIWHGILSEMGMVVVSSTLTVGPIEDIPGCRAENPQGPPARRSTTPSSGSRPIWTGGPRRRGRKRPGARRPIRDLRPALRPG